MSNMNNEKFIRESELYQHQIVEIMKEYGLIYEEEEASIEEYLFNTNQPASAK